MEGRQSPAPGPAPARPVSPLLAVLRRHDQERFLSLPRHRAAIVERERFASLKSPLRPSIKSGS